MIAGCKIQIAFKYFRKVQRLNDLVFCSVDNVEELQRKEQNILLEDLHREYIHTKSMENFHDTNIFGFTAYDKGNKY